MKAWSGHNREQQIFHVDYARVEQIVATLVHRLNNFRLDIVVGIVRAGVVPATMFAQRLGAELHMLRCQRHENLVTWLGDPPPIGSRILLVDDIISRGDTMRRAKETLLAQGYQVVTAALYVDRDRSTFEPDIALDAPGFIRFSWDRRETTPEARRLIAAGVEAFPPGMELETECFGVDMDGVLLPDIRKPHYRRNLEASLRRRHVLSPFSKQKLPAIDWRKAHIITARPQEDFTLTRSWLDQHGFEASPLYCRNPDQYDASTEAATAHKISTLMKIGVSTFIESELIQAAIIAESCPTVDVVWWGRKHRLRLGGVSRTSFEAALADDSSNSSVEKKT